MQLEGVVVEWQQKCLLNRSYMGQLTLKLRKKEIEISGTGLSP
jgi:hypothetical protein